MCKNELFIFRWHLPHGINYTIMQFRLKSGGQLRVQAMSRIT
jgi:hypothetical protein